MSPYLVRSKRLSRQIPAIVVRCHLVQGVQGITHITDGHCKKSFVVVAGGGFLCFGLIPVCHNLPIWRGKTRNILMKKTMATRSRMGDTTSTSRTNKKLTPQQRSLSMTLFRIQENTTSTMTNTMRTSRRKNQAKMAETQKARNNESVLLE